MSANTNAAAALQPVFDRLARRLARMKFGPPTAYVYNPLDYARAPWDQYVGAYARPGVRCLLLGMNPGPWGMMQTGVPFGEVAAVRDWLRIDAAVRPPKRVHPQRPVLGLACTRSEVSGARLWGWARENFGTPAAFFKRFFVANYCPLVFLEAGARNRTPDKLVAAEREPLLEACDEALRELCAVLSPQMVVGVGQFAESRARAALAGLPLQVHRILHPSPASPAANRDWPGQVTRKLREIGLLG